MATLPVLEFSSTPFLVRPQVPQGVFMVSIARLTMRWTSRTPGSAPQWGGNTEAGGDVTSPGDND
jgi:hypothetical protein